MQLNKQMTEEAKHKQKFRQSAKWKKFRQWLKKERKIDPITGSRLVARCQCHHCCMLDSEYENLNPDNFEMLNPTTHKVIHFLFETRDWRRALEEIKRILEKMERLN